MSFQEMVNKKMMEAKIEEEIKSVSTGTFQNMTAGRAINDNDGNKISATYVKRSDLDRLILETEYPVGGKPYIQFDGMKTPAERWAGTKWEINTDYQGRVIVGSGGEYIFGETGGAFTQTLDPKHLPKLSGTIQFNSSTDYNGALVPNGGASGVFSTSGETYNYHARGTNAGSGYSYSVVSFNVGNNEAHSIMQPYKVTNIWKRIA